MMGAQFHKTREILLFLKLKKLELK